MSAFVVGDDEIKAVLKQLMSVANGQQMQSAFSSIGESLVSNIQQGFKDQQDPWGNRWKPLSSITIARRKKGKGSGSPKILLDTGKLRNSINYQATANGVEVGTSDLLGKAAMHQFGGTIQGRMFRGAKVPARPFMPIRGGKADLPNDWQAEIVSILHNRLAQAMKGR